jgi:hypothetical protein
MGLELITTALLTALIAIPVLAWMILRRISSADRSQDKAEELRSLENSLSLMIKELQESVQKAMLDMEEAADRLNQRIEEADDRIRQLQYYYEYGEELRPLTQPRQSNTTLPANPQAHILKHKEVHELSRKGWSAAQIARHTGMSTDEVQLIVNLMEISPVGTPLDPQPRQPMV